MGPDPDSDPVVHATFRAGFGWPTNSAGAFWVPEGKTAARAVQELIAVCCEVMGHPASRSPASDQQE